MSAVVRFTTATCGTVEIAGASFEVRQINVRSQLVLEELALKADTLSPAEKAERLLTVVAQVTGAPVAALDALDLSAVKAIIDMASAPLLKAQAELASTEGNGAGGAVAPASAGPNS